MEEESEELYETAQVLLDPETGSFTDEVSEQLEYVGSALLVMNRVTLDPPWRGHGLAAVLACEVITRLMAALPGRSLFARHHRSQQPSADGQSRVGPRERQNCTGVGEPGFPSLSRQCLSSVSRLAGP